MRRPGDDERDPCTSGADDSSLEDLVARLESNPDECLGAFEGLESLEPETRLAIIRGLGDVTPGPGVVNLLRLLAGSDDEATREAARVVLEEIDGPSPPHTQVEDVGTEIVLATGPSGTSIPALERSGPTPIRCLITAVDGSGRGTIVVSSRLAEERRTAAFLCDLLNGITGAVGTLEDEAPEAGGLADEVKSRAEVDAIEAPPELARGLLAGCLTLNEPPVMSPVEDWLEATLGTGFRPDPFPGLREDAEMEEGLDLLDRAGKVLDACPTWLDESPLTLELAEELLLREGRVTADPRRDAGAFRFLFEHRIIHRLELYRRMLLWMAWFWTCGGHHELAASARVLGVQLADEQYAVPSHPFATVLIARSLEAPQRRFGSTGPTGHGR
jgi:hypothetical protein